MSRLLLLAIFLLAATRAAGEQESRLYNPYERPKNGPPLTNVFLKVEPSWLLAKLREPRSHPSARMPDFKLTEDEALDIMAYLKGIVGESPAAPAWPTWAAKASEEMDDDEFAAMSEVTDRGKAVWRIARCTICHTVYGPGGALIGGFVDLRVGGIDLQRAGTKLKRDWLYHWIREPKAYFPDTLMPRYRFTDDEIVALVEYILRDGAFRPPTAPQPEPPERWSVLDEPARAERGQRQIELSRCVVCHDIKRIAEVLSLPERRPPPAPGGFEFLAYDLRCLSCHSIADRGGTYAPDLTGAGSRLHEGWIAKFVESPDMLRPLSQQMPKFNLTASEATIIASYISTTRLDTRIPAGISGDTITSQQVQRGHEAVKSRGCFSCHTVGEGPGGVVGPDLHAVGDRLKPGYIWYHLKDPHAVNPYSAEPDYGLADDEATALEAYLLTRGK